MDKPKANNAFTSLEMLLVLLIVCVLASSTSTIPSLSSLNLFGEKMLSYCVWMQEKAFSQKEKIEVKIEQDHARFDTIEFQFPNDITCEPHSFHYTAKGNISKGNTITCSNQNETIQLIFQIGSGRVRLE